MKSLNKSLALVIICIIVSQKCILGQGKLVVVLVQFKFVLQSRKCGHEIKNLQ